MRRRWLTAALGVGLAATLALSPASADETAPRPSDSPRIDSSAHAPPLPPEYLTEDLGWIRFAFHPSARERVRPLLARAAEIRAELVAQLGRDDVLRSIDVRVAKLPAEIPRLTPAEVPGYTSAVSFSQLGLIVMSIDSPLSLEPTDLEGHLRHQLAHVALDQATGGRGVPRWLHEGFAANAGGSTSARAEVLALAALRRRLVPLPQLDAYMPVDVPDGSVAHAQAADVVRFLTTHERRGGFAVLVARLAEGDGFEAALGKAFGSDGAAMESSWRRDVGRRYAFFPVLIGAGLLYLLVAGGIAVRRALRRRAERGRDARPEKPRRRDRKSRESRMPPGRPTPRHLEVPKVEHGGRWHTLH